MAVNVMITDDRYIQNTCKRTTRRREKIVKIKADG